MENPFKKIFGTKVKLVRSSEEPPILQESKPKTVEFGSRDGYLTWRMRDGGPLNEENVQIGTPEARRRMEEILRETSAGKSGQ